MDSQTTASNQTAGTLSQILFLGVDSLWFGQVKRDMGCLYPSWSCALATDARLGPMKPEWNSADAVVIEGSVAGAREWIQSIRKERPDIACVVRCDLASKPAVEAWKGSGLPIIASTIDASALASALLRNVRLREWMADPAVKQILPHIHKLPAMPRLYTQVTEELRSSDSSLDMLAYLIRQDPVMSAKMLQLVNSAFFGLAREVTDMMDAVMILGTERIKSLILLAGVFSQYKESGEAIPSMDALMTHSIQAGVCARAIALAETKSAAMAEAAFTAGVLHDMGKVILAGNLPDRYREARTLRSVKHLSDAAAEMEVFGATHAAVGACLLASWGLPLGILEAVAWHHEPERSPDRAFTLLSAVHAANVISHAPSAVPRGLSAEYFTRIGLPNAAERWIRLFNIPAG